MTTIHIILLFLGGSVLGVIVGYYFFNNYLLKAEKNYFKKLKYIKEQEENLLDEAKEKAQKIVKNKQFELDEIEKKKTKEFEVKMEKLEKLENRLLERESKLDDKLEKLEIQKKEIHERKTEVDAMYDEQKKILEEKSGLSKDEAKQILFDEVEKEYESEKKQLINKLKVILKEEADTEASKIIAQSLPRVGGDHISEYTIVSVDIPSEDFKGRLIGREGRNIMYFEKITGCELIVDDTPLLVRVSSFDNEKRFIAVEALKKMIKDAKINPFYIEKVYNETVEGLDELLMSKGKEALTMLNLPMMNPQIVLTIGKFMNRFSYGQNLRTHSIEVAKMSEAIATELGLDPVLAKKAGLLHDIGKITVQTGESHARVGADLLRKFEVDPVIINAAESHHYEVPMTHPISRVVTAADGMSGARPGARFSTKEIFVDKMAELEKLISNVTGVDKVHIMQAGREIMVYADPENISDIDLEKLLKTIGEKIEEQLDYPGIIRVVGIREKRMVEFIK